MIASFLAFWTVTSGPYADCFESPATRLCIERRRAYDAGDHKTMFTLVDDEVATVRRVLAGVDADAVGRLKPLCLPLEAGFHMCNERRPELGCGRRFLDAYATEGCLDDPAQRPRFHNLDAMYRRSHHDFPRALAALQHAELETVRLVLSRRDASVVPTATAALLVAAATRAELAAQTRAMDVLKDSLARLDILRVRLDGPRHASVVADTLNQTAWSLLLARESELTVDDPTPLLEAALATFSRTRRNAGKADNVRINLALAALQRGEPAAALKRAAEVTTDLGDEERMWLRLVQLRAAVADARDLDSARWQSELEAIAAGGRVAMAEWFAASTRGFRMERLGRTDDALADYEAAEAALERHASRGSARDAFADRRYLSFAAPTRRLVRLLVEHGRPERAEWIARRARSRALRADSHCSGAGLGASPGAGELRLLYFRVEPSRPDATATAWIGFAVTGWGVRAAEIVLEPVPHDLHGRDDESLRSWSDALLLPFADDIEPARTIEILATDVLHKVPFAALPWADGALIDHAPVRFGLDLAPCDNGGPAGPAVVIHGPEAALAAEAEAVAEARAATGQPTSRLLPRSAVELARAFDHDHWLVHVALHGVRAEGAELFAADDRLLLAGVPALTRNEILVAERVPALVFLSSCRVSFSDAETLGGGLGLAHAFLLRGARFVVGASDDVDGWVAQTFAAHFYRELADHDLADVPRAWQAAYLATRDAIPPDLAASLHMLRLYAR